MSRSLSATAAAMMNCSDRGNDNGVGMTRGGQRLAMQDEMRRQWLDAKMPAWRRESRKRYVRQYGRPKR